MILIRRIWQILFQPAIAQPSAPPPHPERAHRQARLALILALALLFGYRLAVFVRGPYISSDSKNYLATMNQVWGEDFTGYGLDRPPLITVPLKLAAVVLGPIAGSQVVGALISVLIAIPFWSIARRLAAPWPAALGTLLFASSPMYSEMLAWGYITFFGILFSLSSFYYIIRAIEAPRPDRLLLAGLMASLVMGFHQTSLVVMMLIVALWLALLVLPGGPPRRRAMATVATVAIIGLILALPYFPSYFSQANKLSTSYVTSLGQLRSLGQIVERSLYFFGRHAPLWALAVPLMGLGIAFLAGKGQRLWAALAAAILAVALVLNLFDAADPADRSAYLAFSGLWLLATAGIEWLRRATAGRRVWANAALAGLIAYAGYAEYAANAPLSALARYYDSMDAGQVAAAEWIGAVDIAPRAGIATHPGGFADWIRGLAGRNAYGTVAPIRGAWVQQTEQAQAAIAVLSGHEALDNGNLHVATGYPAVATQWLMLSTYVLSYGSGQTTCDVLLLDENRAAITYQADGTEQTVTFADALAVESHIEEAEDRISLITHYQFADFTIERMVRLKYGERKLALKYEFEGDGVEFESLSMPLRIPTGRADVKETAAGVNLTQKHTFGNTTCQVAVDESDISGWSTDLEGYDTSGRLVLEFDAPNPDARFNVNVKTPYSVIDAALRHDDTPAILQAQDIRFVAFDQTPPSEAIDPLSSAVFDWVDAAPYYFPIYRQDDVYVYRVLSDAEQAPQHAAGARIGQEIDFQGWTLLDDGQPEYGQLSLILFWAAEAAPTRDYKVFAHLLDAQGQLVAQHDSMPARWHRPTTSWAPGEAIADQHRLELPGELPAGEYTLRVGMYDADSGERLPVTDAQGQAVAGDELLLTTIQVQE
jgi:hypothetical protein